MKSSLLFALILGLLAISVVDCTSECTWGGLGFNPYDRWNVFSFNDIGSAAVPYGSDFQGRGAAMGNVWMKTFSWNILGDNSWPFAATAGGTFSHIGGDAVNGGIQAGGKVTVKSMHVQGDIISVSDTIELGGTSSGESVTGTGAARAALFFTAGTGSSMAGGIFPNSAGLSLLVAPGKTLADVKAFFVDQSADYLALANTVTTASYSGGSNGDLIIPVTAGVNVLTIPHASHAITAVIFKNAARLLLKGDTTGKLIINIAGDHALDTLEVFEHPTSNSWTTRPNFGRLLLNFHDAVSLTMISPSYFSILAPNANLVYESGVIHGNVIVNNLFDPNGLNGQVNLWNWQPECPDAPIPPTPPSPQDTGVIPSPPESCPECIWDEILGFNPWQAYNVFSLGNIGSSANPCGADYQGRVAAVGGGWFKSFSLHDINQGSPPFFSGSFGGDFSLIGGSIKNGGIEAGGNVYIESADVRGSVVAMGTATIGVTNKAVTVFGAVSAGADIFYPALQSKATLGFFPFASPLSITAPLSGIASFFQLMSSDYAATPNTLVQGTDYTFTPGPANPNTITVTLKPGMNFMQLTASQLQKASRLNLKGDTTGVLVINVLNTGAVTFDSLDVYEGPPWVLGTSFGRVLVNIPNAASITVPWGSGHWSLLAPNTPVTYISGVWSGNWIVGDLICAPGGSGGGQINVHPWNPPCPECPPEPETINYIACEYDTFEIDCGDGFEIEIVSAHYGRNAGGEVCPGAIESTSCGVDKTAFMSTICDGLPSCSGAVSNAVFQDNDCHGTRKYIEVNYICNPGSPSPPDPSGRQFEVQSMGSRYSAGSLREFQSQRFEIPRWVYAVGAAMSGVALSALIVAGVALHKLSRAHVEFQKLKSANKRRSAPVTPPHSSSPSVSHRGIGGKFAASP